MKRHLFRVAGLLAALSSVPAAPAAITVLDPAYSVAVYKTNVNSDNIISYDWDGSGNLYYATGTPSFNFGGLYKSSGGTPTQVVAGSSDFSGTNVIAIGNNVYYNTSDFTQQKIYKYGPLSGSPGSSLISTTTNYGIYAHAGQVFITGAPGFGTNHIYQTDLDGSGNFVSNPAKDLGVTAGSSGPLTWDTDGNLYYAPGFNDLSIYKWSPAEVAAAIAGTPLSVSGHLWLDYESLYAAYSGGTSMLIDGDGNLLMTLTSFSDPSLLVRLGVDGLGAYSGTATNVLSDTNLLGELRSHDGTVYVSTGNQIIKVVPEPSTWALMLIGGIALVFASRARTRRAAAAAVFLASASAWAGPYSPSGELPGGAGVAANDPRIVGWGTTVITATRGPVDITVPGGTLASFGTTGDALGASDATVDSPYPVYSLGDGGSIVIGFAHPIYNGAGTDFAVFENALKVDDSNYFFELAFVEVSSNGTDFFRFPSVSLTQSATQLPSFGTLDPTNLYNLAGKDLVGYGTAFNLDDLAGISPLLDINAITQVKIIDVVGSINPLYARYDSLGHIINDPWKTNFNTGGFDLDAIGALYQVPEPGQTSLVLVGLGLVALLARNQLQLKA
jgi:hypothetical protein